MKKLLIKATIFVSIVFTILIFGILSLYKIIDQGNYYKLDKKYDNLIFGHSHSECAFNDKKIANTLNISNSGESYFYTYFKVKKIIENNKIKNVFISFTNNYIEYTIDTTEIWKEKYLNKWYSKYGAYMTSEDLLLLLKKNLKGILNAQSLASKKYLTFLIKRKKSIIEDLSWGKYKYLNRNKLDSLLRHKDTTNEKIINFKYSKYNLQYLDKILKICKENKINVYLVRSPVHHAWGALSNEYYFKKLVNERYKKYEFLDFKDFPLENNSYGDLSHLNHFGASKFSLFFNNLLEDKLLEKQDKQEFINVEMAKLKTDNN
ncbi:hypothetical protein [Flavobacterium sp.]|uniref:hypothetical protein n=1 Tax=Flavobacterium sp. TaxID=239 RepID=UPI0038FC6ABB